MFKTQKHFHPMYAGNWRLICVGNKTDSIVETLDYGIFEGRRNFALLFVMSLVTLWLCSFLSNNISIPCLASNNTYLKICLLLWMVFFEDVDWSLYVSKDREILRDYERSDKTYIFKECIFEDVAKKTSLWSLPSNITEGMGETWRIWWHSMKTTF